MSRINKKPALKTKAGAPKTDLPASNLPQNGRYNRIEQFLSQHKQRVIGLLLLLWFLVRFSMLQTVLNGPLYQMYVWKESDNCFFDEWARTLAAGDWLNRQPLHPYHGWHQQIADAYFKIHPEKLTEIMSTKLTSDSSFVAGKILWNNWYGGNVYHQEPLYAYLLAILYRITGNGIYWMMLLQGALGIASGYLLFKIAARHFGYTVATLTGFLYLFCGIILFQEALVLRSCWVLFFTLSIIRQIDRALAGKTNRSFIILGLMIGTAVLLQSVFVLFVPGFALLYRIEEGKLHLKNGKKPALTLFACLLMLFPLLIRNACVNAPLFSISSVGAITFIASNTYKTQTISTWMPDVQKCAEVMGETGGAFGASIRATLETHPSFSSYAGLLWSKLCSIFHGTEWPNNENYYFYKSITPAIQIAFVDFYWIIGASTAGIIFSISNRKKHRTLYLAILVQLIVLLGFYVLGRFRTPLAAILLPFAAFALVDSLRSLSSTVRVWGPKFTVLLVCVYLFSWKNYQTDQNYLDKSDYIVLYGLAYNNRVRDYAAAQQWSPAIALHAAFLECAPSFLKHLKPGNILQHPSLVDIAELFAFHEQMQSDLYGEIGDQVGVVKYRNRAAELTQIVENSTKRLHR